MNENTPITPIEGEVQSAELPYFPQDQIQALFDIRLAIGELDNLAGVEDHLNTISDTLWEISKSLKQLVDKQHSAE